MTVEETGWVWDSDPEAQKALDSFLRQKKVDWPLAKIRCMGHRDGKSVVLGEVWFSQYLRFDNLVLRLFYWPQGVGKTNKNRKVMEIFLNKAGDYGLYCCREHKIWRADIRFVRQRIEARWIQHTTVVVPVWPPGTVTPPEDQFHGDDYEDEDGLSFVDRYIIHAGAKRAAQAQFEKEQRRKRYALGRRGPIGRDARR
jgi:hypothetical protein